MSLALSGHGLFEVGHGLEATLVSRDVRRGPIIVLLSLRIGAAKHRAIRARVAHGLVAEVRTRSKRLGHSCSSYPTCEIPFRCPFSPLWRSSLSAPSERKKASDGRRVVDSALSAGLRPGGDRPPGAHPGGGGGDNDEDNGARKRRRANDGRRGLYRRRSAGGRRRRRRQWLTPRRSGRRHAPSRRWNDKAGTDDDETRRGTRARGGPKTRRDPDRPRRAHRNRRPASAARTNPTINLGRR
jgi:hypothetical protein